ncbi:MAG: TIGR00730 family Rossman fold protein [Pseudomonadota bacterium]
MKKAAKAYKNTDFLKSSDARTIRLLAEYLEPESRFRKYNITDTVVFFGSARIDSPENAQAKLDQLKASGNAAGNESEERSAQLYRAETGLKISGYYRDAEALAFLLTQWSKETFNHKKEGRRFIICSGGGPGIMEAANKGASEAGGYSIGLNISLPFEQEPNPYVSTELMFEFHYFFIRKFWFAYLAKALIIFPGGFGTVDEMMEILTLVQTKKITKPLPIIIYGTDYWKSIIDFEGMVKWGMISRKDLDLFHFSDTPGEAFEYLKDKLEKL